MPWSMINPDAETRKYVKRNLGGYKDKNYKSTYYREVIAPRRAVETAERNRNLKLLAYDLRIKNYETRIAFNKGVIEDRKNDVTRLLKELRETRNQVLTTKHIERRLNYIKNCEKHIAKFEQKLEEQKMKREKLLNAV